MAQHIQDFCEDKAREGNGSFAIAYAILELARASSATARALERLGTAGADTNMGAIELLSNELRDGAQLLADAIEAMSSAERD